MFPYKVNVSIQGQCFHTRSMFPYKVNVSMEGHVSIQGNVVFLILWKVHVFQLCLLKLLFFVRQTVLHQSYIFCTSYILTALCIVCSVFPICVLCFRFVCCVFCAQNTHNTQIGNTAVFPICIL